MEREIMFRAWDKDSSTMFYSENNNTEEMYFHFNNRQIQLLCPVEDDYPEVRDCVIMQYMGLKDKNDFELCEGDIVKTKYQELAKIIWNQEFACFCYETIDEIIKDEYQFSFKPNEIEILGNLYENPELLSTI